MSRHEEIYRAAAMFDAGDLASAGQIFASIVNDPQVPDFERAMMAINLATVHDRMGNLADALTAYDAAIGFAVKPYAFVQGNRASFLYERGYREEAIALWEHLLSIEQIEPDRRKTFEQNLQTARSQG
jgi:tetratricopeptide (TPR) repeat protein